MSLLPKTRLGLAMICLISFTALMALFYGGVDWQGTTAWKRCKAELAAKGAVLDWKTLIPPPVPDDQNFFKSPKMAEWFAKANSGHFSNELTSALDPDRLIRSFANSNGVAIANITWLPIIGKSGTLSNKPDISLRYSSVGQVFFVETNLIENDATSTNENIPMIVFSDVPITTGIASLARQGEINYMLDPAIGYGQRDEDGNLKREPVISVSWRNISCEQALFAILEANDLQLIKNPKTGVARITVKPPSAPHTYLSADDRKYFHEMLASRLGHHAIGFEKLLFLADSPAPVNLLRVTCHSETPPSKEDCEGLFEQVFAGDTGQDWAPFVYAQKSGSNQFQVAAAVLAAANFLHGNDRLEAYLDPIREALKRPYARMDGDYSSESSTPVVNVVALRETAMLLADRVKCHILENHPAEALEELTLLNKLRRITEAAPTGMPMQQFVTSINGGIAGLSTDLIAEGQRQHIWNDAQLFELQSQLGKVDLVSLLVNGLKTQQAGMSSIMEAYQHNPAKGRNFSLWPQGLVHHNMIAAEKTDQRLVEAFHVPEHFVRPKEVDAAVKDIRLKQDDFLPLTKLAYLVVYNLTPGIRNCMYRQAMMNEAQIACALERYHLASGEYPVNLDGLVPQFIARVPSDPINGLPFHYFRKGTKYLLYSVGWNETDNDGDSDLGDWVWDSRAE